ncbi:hypothetical protein [Poseidonocella sedimentorum]|uniref:hypothetical protein n=1 Tax=Poseidonocella sedimentorum TaxID=871652 RepID=UPI000ABAA5B2|nr:hypothetical protein [Poseidonocella sedimentorum]
MIGVVIWSDRADRKAVIWCEDHGNLAYLTNEGAPIDETPELEEGDLVQFRLTERKSMRLARDVAVVESEAYSDLSGALKANGDMDPVIEQAMMGNVVQLHHQGLPMARTA